MSNSVHTQAPAAPCGTASDTLPGLNAALVAGAVHQVWNSQDLLGEGTLWSVRDASIYWVDILGRVLQRYTPATNTYQRWVFEEEMSALAERHGHPGLLVTLRHDFAFFDPRTGTLERICRAEADKPGNRFNDAKCDAQGRFWAGTMDFDCKRATGAIYRLGSDATCTRLHPGYVVNNGPTWSLDGRTMYLNDTVQGRVQAFDFDPVQGTLAHERTWLQFAPDDGFPDGMTTDSAGRLWIAHWGSACVTCHDPLSTRELARIAVPASQVTNCVFGGADLRTLFISSARTGLSPEQLAREPQAGGLFSVQMHCQGLASPPFVSNCV